MWYNTLNTLGPWGKASACAAKTGLGTYSSQIGDKKTNAKIGRGFFGNPRLVRWLVIPRCLNH